MGSGSLEGYGGGLYGYPRCWQVGGGGIARRGSDDRSEEPILDTLRCDMWHETEQPRR